MQIPEGQAEGGDKEDSEGAECSEQDVGWRRANNMAARATNYRQ